MTNPYPKNSMEWYQCEYEPEGEVGTTRHDKTQYNVRRGIADFVKRHGAARGNLLEIGGYTGWHTVCYRDQIRDAQRTVIYDWQDFRTKRVREFIEFNCVDLEGQRFPDADSAFDVVVCNQVFEHLKNIYWPISEIHRVLKPGGHLVISVPNISALHNCILLALGRQPTTMDIMGSHVRGYAVRSFSKFLELNHHFRIIELKGYGLHPFTSQRMAGFLRTYCHTPVWLLEKTASSLPLWNSVMGRRFTTTKFSSEKA